MADTLTAKPWYALDSQGNMTQQNQGGTPTASSWTSGGLTTTGIMNPFGLKTNAQGAVIDPYNGNNSNVPSNAYWSAATGGWITPTNNTVPAPTSSAPDYAPYGFGNTDPVGDARRAASNTSNPTWTPDATQQTPVYGGGAQSTPTAINPLTNAPYSATPTTPTSNTSGLMGQTFKDANGQTWTFNGTSFVQTPSQTVTSGVPNIASQGPNGTQNTTAAPTSTSSTGQNPFSFLQGSTTTSPDPGNNGQFLTQQNNPNQFATPETASIIARLLGGKNYESQLTGPGFNYSQPQQLIQAGNVSGINAGLAANTLNNFGQSGQGSYGAYLLARDMSGNQAAFPSYDQWAATQPGYNPGTRAPNATDTVQYAQNPQAPQYQQQQVPPNIPQQSAQNTPDLLSQLGSIMQLLSLLGLTQSTPRQRPPALQQPSNLLSNYYSRFA